jgi:hypothetical protein
MLTLKQWIVTGWLCFLFVYWAVLNFALHSTDGTWNFLYSFLFSIMPLIGGAIGMYQAGQWGRLKSHVGKAVFLISLGLFLWGSGSMVWSYYNFFVGVAAPYPSLADLGFAPSIFFYGWGAIYLAKALGAKYGLRNKIAKIFVVFAPLIILAISYHVLIVIARGGVLIPEGEDALKALLDLAYPLGDFISLAVAVVVSGLSFPYLGGKYKWDAIAILLGLGTMYIGDFMFSYTTTVGTFYVGNYGDLILTIGLFFLTLGVLGFDTAKVKDS